MNQCKGRAVPGDHFWSAPEYYKAFGIEVEVTHCTMCGQRKLRRRWRYRAPANDASEWEMMISFTPVENAEATNEIPSR